MGKFNLGNLYPILFAISFVAGIASDSNAQHGMQHRNSIQFTYGLLHTFHHNAPAPLRYCIEGCSPNLQEGRDVHSVELGFYHKWNNNNELMFGVGLNRYEFFELGQASAGAGIDFPYDRIVENRYYSFSIGQRYIFLPSNAMKPFFENHLLYERLRSEDYFLKLNNLAIRTKIGLLIKLGQNVDIVSGGVFKSAIANYGRTDSRIKYFPFSYGGEIGLVVH